MNEKERIAWQQHGMRRHPMAGLGTRAVWGVLGLIALYWGWHLVRFIVAGGAQLP